MWAPDHPFNKAKSLAATYEFANLCLRNKALWKVGVIPQGRTAQEVATSYRVLSNTFHHIGLSFLNDREAVMSLLGYDLLGPKLHMLGLSYLDETKLWPRIPLTTDTSKPLKAAFRNKSLKELQKGEGLLLPTDIIGNLDLARDNIKALRQACND